MSQRFSQWSDCTIGIMHSSTRGGSMSRKPDPSAGRPDRHLAAAISLVISTLAGGSTTVLADERLSSEQMASALGTYCYKCHNFEDYAGGMALEMLDFNDLSQAAEVGEKIVRTLSAGVMPPPGEPRPDRAGNKQLVASLEAKLDE